MKKKININRIAENLLITILSLGATWFFIYSLQHEDDEFQINTILALSMLFLVFTAWYIADTLKHYFIVDEPKQIDESKYFIGADPFDELQPATQDEAALYSEMWKNIDATFDKEKIIKQKLNAENSINKMTIPNPFCQQIKEGLPKYSEN